jgi:SAM-dependent methyltransferase
VAGLATRILAKAKNRDIILLHDVMPPRGTKEQLLREFEALLAGLAARGLTVTPLSRLIGQEIMHSRELQAAQTPVELFYNGLAPTYDAEQFGSRVAISRRKEHELFSARIPELFRGADRVLEIGAGTGIFTIDIARNCREVLAVDLSRNMLAVLAEKAHAEGLANIRAIAGDIETMPLEGDFSAVCAFLSFEYMSDLPALFNRLADHMPPGAHLYFTVARRSLFRLFTQIGNAMRQGVWLKAHSRRELENWLQAAGFEPLAINAHLCKTWFSGGMLLEVVARKTAGKQAGTPAGQKDSR